MKSENGPISDFKNPGFRSHKTWSNNLFIVSGVYLLLLLLLLLLFYDLEFTEALVIMFKNKFYCRISETIFILNGIIGYKGVSVYR